MTSVLVSTRAALPSPRSTPLAAKLACWVLFSFAVREHAALLFVLAGEQRRLRGALGGVALMSVDVGRAAHRWPSGRAVRRR
jgi:hypothetical protein